MLVTVFVFIGIEGASVYSRFAKEREDVGKATISGFVIVTSLMVLVTLLPFAVLQRADDCRVLAVSTDCVATAWDVSEPLNQIYAGSGGGPEAAARGAIAAAGPYANDLQVRCTWWPRGTPAPPTPPVPSAPGTVLTARLLWVFSRRLQSHA
jgi:amino acid transporter